MPIFLHRRFRHRLASRASGQPRDGRDGTRIDRSGRGRARRPNLPPGSEAWSDAHFEPLRRIARFVADQEAAAGIQLANAGRKASTHRPWSGAGKIDEADGGWVPLAPSALPFSASYPMPREMTVDDIQAVEHAFVMAAERALRAGFRVIELHAAHGYLFHEFLSPLSNKRIDSYGGSFENRTRFLRDTVVAVRKSLPDSCPLFVRISAVDWVPGGWDIEQSVELARLLKPLGVDLIDCSSGGNIEGAEIPVGAGYHLPFADRIRRQADIPTAAVGMITGAAQADQMIRNNQTDLVLLARDARIAARPVLAAACRTRAGASIAMAGTIFAGRAQGHAAT